MNFDLNENQKMIAQMVRDFAEKEIRPHMNKWDDEEYFPVDTMKKMGELGLLGIYIPEQYGGSGFGYFEYATALMELTLLLIKSFELIFVSLLPLEIFFSSSSILFSISSISISVKIFKNFKTSRSSIFLQNCQ